MKFKSIRAALKPLLLYLLRIFKSNKLIKLSFIFNYDSSKILLKSHCKSFLILQKNLW